MNEPHETNLARAIKARIRKEGPITFRDFMDTALYDPHRGFYARGPIIGTEDGTFNTNAMYPAFGFALARAVEWADALVGQPLRVVEFGGGTGQLATAILSFLFRPHEYVVVDVSHGLRTKQHTRGIRAVEKVSDLPPEPTFAFGNEVLDALPVHRVMGDGNGQLLELYVTIDEQGEFIEHPDQPSTPLLAARLESEGVRLGRGQLAEVNLALDEFVAEAARILERGYLMFVDYGDHASALYAHTRRNGTLRCYQGQRQVFDVFDRIGEQDLTADVDFTAVENVVQRAGLLPAGRAMQGEWLHKLKIHEYVSHAQDKDTARDEVALLTSPARLGSAFDVVAFKTAGLPNAPGL